MTAADDAIGERRAALPACTDTGANAATATNRTALCRQRVALLQALFERIAQVRMAGLPVLNPRLQVQAVGFEPQPLDDALALPEDDAALGVLITPWFMNLVWLPLRRSDRPAHPDLPHERSIADGRVAFIGASEPALGYFEGCSLFSPMFDFGSQASAEATARHVLHELRPRPMTWPTPPAAPGRGHTGSGHPAARALAEPGHGGIVQPARRSFLLGRRGPAP